jgi:vesicle transport protein SEC22
MPREQTEQKLQEHKQQAKLIFRRITPNSEPRCSIESGPYTLECVQIVGLLHDAKLTLWHSYLIANNVVYLTIAEKSYPRKLAFSYLDELQKEFDQSHGSQVDAVRKPYAFLSFGVSRLLSGVWISADISG